LGLIPGEERTLRLNDIQVAWSYLNVIEDQKEMQQMIFEFLDWYKWYVNPKMAKAMQDKDKHDVSMDEGEFAKMVASGLRKEGKTEKEIEQTLIEAGLIKDD